MRVPANQLRGQLKKQLTPIYLLTGDEPLQLGEAADAIRQTAREAGYTNREIMDAVPQFDWNRLTIEANSLSLFAEKKVIDLRIPNGKPGREGSAALTEYCQNLPEDTLLLITLPKLDRAQFNGKWFKTIDRLGVVVQIWPVDTSHLPRWITQRMQAAGLRPEAGVAEMLADQTEGNLLATDQEIEKLRLLHEGNSISAEQLSMAISDSSRFDIFSLVDSTLAGHASRSIRMLNGLQAEGVAAPVVLWALVREVRSLLAMAREMSKGASPDQAMNKARVWEKRKAVVRKGLQRIPHHEWQHLLKQCQLTDAAIKGVGQDNPWQLMEDICLKISGYSVVVNA